jgi:hypothetical protein
MSSDRDLRPLRNWERIYTYSGRCLDESHGDGTADLAELDDFFVGEVYSH